MTQKKYVSLSKLSTFLNNLSDKFAALIHNHTLSDISDYNVDTELNNTSSNPVANKTINTEFNSVAERMSVVESAIDNIDLTNYYTKTETDNLELITVDDIDNIVLSSGEFTFVSLTQAEYDALVTSGDVDEKKYYIIEGDT